MAHLPPVGGYVYWHDPSPDPKTDDEWEQEIYDCHFVWGCWNLEECFHLCWIPEYGPNNLHMLPSRRFVRSVWRSQEFRDKQMEEWGFIPEKYVNGDQGLAPSW